MRVSRGRTTVASESTLGTIGTVDVPEDSMMTVNAMSPRWPQLRRVAIARPRSRYGARRRLHRLLLQPARGAWRPGAGRDDVRRPCPARQQPSLVVLARALAGCAGVLAMKRVFGVVAGALLAMHACAATATPAAMP